MSRSFKISMVLGLVVPAASCADSQRAGDADEPSTAAHGGKPTGEATELPSSGGGGRAANSEPVDEAEGEPAEGEPAPEAAGAGGGAELAGGDAGGAAALEPAAGTAGEPEGGAAGAAGAPGHSAAGEACLACGAAACGSAVQSCEQNPDCAGWLDCVQSADSSAAARACDAKYRGVSRLYYGVYACWCGACAAECDLAESCQKRCDADALPPRNRAPATLAETGLYTEAHAIASWAHAYDVQFPLWADGAGKGRYVYVPECATIDTSDMDHWEFPVGTRFWKEFAVDDRLIETRLLHRFGSGPEDWLFATYGWDPSRPLDPSAARLVEHGQPSAAGTLHDIPDPSACPTCHGKLPERVLGFSAIQLSHGEAGLNMQRLSDGGWLSVPARGGFEVPGTPVQRAALGYLHGNCGGCHNRNVDIPREGAMRLRLLVGQRDYARTDTLQTTLGVPTLNPYPELNGKPRVAPGEPARSAVYLRMSDRNKFPMPPLASKFSDTDGGVALVKAWIESL